MWLESNTLTGEGQESVLEVRAAFGGPGREKNWIQLRLLAQGATGPGCLGLSSCHDSPPS